MIYDNTQCSLGEGPLWHPFRQQLFWFDILSKSLHSNKNGLSLKWQFSEYVSAAGWIDREHLLIASETQLFKFNLDTCQQSWVCDLEADNSTTRSNDGRADPWGGFWIGTMGKQAEPNAGAIYRYFNGELRKLKSNISISNAICFSPDRLYSYHTDTTQQIIWRTSLNKIDGWPNESSQLFIDLSCEGLNPDGAVCDSEGNLWIAQWGAARVAQYSKMGQFLQAIELPTKHITCPAFGGEQLNQLYITSALQGLSKQEQAESSSGVTFVITTKTAGLHEPQVNI